MNMRTKFLIPTILGMIGLGLTIYAIATTVFRTTIDESIVSRQKNLIAAISRESDLLADRALQLSSILAVLPEVEIAYNLLNKADIDDPSDPQVQIVREKLRRDLAPYLSSFAANSGSAMLQAHFHLPNNRSLLRVWREKQALKNGRWVDISDDLSDFRRTVVQVNQEHQSVKGVELGRGGFTIRGIAPIRHKNGNHAGSVEILYSYDKVLHSVLDPANTRFALFMNARYSEITTAFNDRQKHPRIGAKNEAFILVTRSDPNMQLTDIVSQSLDTGSHELVSRWQNQLYYSFFPVFDFSGKSIGVVQLVTDESAAAAATKQFRMSVSGATASLILLLSALLLWIGRRITRPLREMTGHLHDIAYEEGDLHSRLNTTSTDEIGELARLFNEFVSRLQSSFSGITGNLTDLQKKVHALSVSKNEPPSDTGNSLHETPNDSSHQVRSIAEATQITSSIMEKVEMAIAERSRIEEAQRLLVAIVESSNDAILAVDHECRILTWNLGAQRLYGYAPKEILGHSLDVLVDESQSGEMKSIRDAIQNGQPFRNYETMRKTKQGHVFPVSLLVSPIESKAGGPRRAAVIERDITRRKELETSAEIRQKQLMQADKLASLGTLVAGMAHEISNPNSFIMLNTPIVLEIWMGVQPYLDRYYEESGDFVIGNMSYATCRDWVPTLLEDIGKGAERIKGIVSNLKDFARQDISSMDQDVDLNEVIRSAIALTNNRLKKSTQHLSLDLANNLPTFKGSFQRIEQVVINLILNACDALPDSERAIRIVTLHHPGEHERVELRLEDEGVGIDPEAINRIKDPFFTTKREMGGTGLGLSISDGIVKDHDGSMLFESSPDKGATVTVSIPIRSHTETDVEKA